MGRKSYNFEKQVLVFLLLAVFWLQACFSFEQVRGSGKVVKQELQVSDFHGVNLATIGKLYVEFGDKEELVIEAEDNLIKYFETEVIQGILRIRTRRGVNLRPRKKVYYYLTVKNLDTIRTSSSGDIIVPKLNTGNFSASVSSSGDISLAGLEVEALQLRISSSGDITLDELMANRLELKISSSGDCKIFDGSVAEQSIGISSSGNFSAKNLVSDKADVNISSSGDARIRVRDHLKVRISSSGDIYYYGNPTVDKKETSSGRVRKQ